MNTFWAVGGTVRLDSAEGQRIHERAVIAAQMHRHLPYLVWAYDYSHASAGPKALHRLCHELNLAGQEAYIGPGWNTNPEWNTPTWQGSLPVGEWIAVYPEIVSGNPWNAPRVARWVLNTPGKLGGDRAYDPTEMVFSYSPLFLADVPLLILPTIETEIYTDRYEPRQGAAFYVGKGAKSRELPGAVEITLAMRQDRHALADVFNRVEILYTFDTVTGMVDIARLCGCPVVVVPDGTHTREQHEPTAGWGGLGWDEIPPAFDSAAYRAQYLALGDTFRDQLAEFIRITQAPRPEICAIIPTRYRPPELDRLLSDLAADDVCVHVVVDTNGREHNINRLWNDGADAARAHGAKFVAVLNDDITLLPGTVPLLARACSHDRVGLVWPDAEAPWDSLPDDPPVRNGTIDDSGRPITGHCFLYRAETGVRFDEAYHWWFSDNQFHKDVLDAGWLAGYVVGVPIQHRAHASAKKHQRYFAPLIEKDRELWIQRQRRGPGLPQGSAYSERHQGSSFGYERP